jgi:hypothetical protein
MVENKNNLVEKVVKAGVIGGLSLLSAISNGQKVSKPLEKINWTKEQSTPYAKYTLLINSKNSLPELSRYKSGVPGEYLSNGGNLNLYPNHYAIPQDQIQGPIADYLRKIDVCPDCCKTPLKRKSNSHTKPKPKPAPTKTPIKPTPKKPTTPVIPTKKPADVPKYDSKKQEEEKSGISYSIETNTTNNVTNNTTNNYYITPEEVKKSNDIHKDTLKKSSLEFRTLIEGSKRIAKNNMGGVSINPQIVAGPFGTGPYAELNFGNVTNVVSTPVYQKTLLNQNLGLFTETDGERVESYKLKYSWGAGWRASINLNKKGNLRADASYGVIKKTDARSGIREKGFDRIIQNEKITDEKPYDIELEKGVTSESLEQVGRVGIEYQPSGKVPLYLKAEVQNIGPIGAKNSETSFNATLGINIGGGKKSK